MVFTSSHTPGWWENNFSNKAPQSRFDSVVMEMDVLGEGFDFKDKSSTQVKPKALNLFQ